MSVGDHYYNGGTLGDPCGAYLLLYMTSSMGRVREAETISVITHSV